MIGHNSPSCVVLLRQCVTKCNSGTILFVLLLRTVRQCVNRGLYWELLN